MGKLRFLMAENSNGKRKIRPKKRTHATGQVVPPSHMKRDTQEERQEKQRKAERRAMEDAVKLGLDPNKVIEHLRTSMAERMYGERQVKNSGIYNE